MPRPDAAKPLSFRIQWAPCPECPHSLQLHGDPATRQDERASQGLGELCIYEYIGFDFCTCGDWYGVG